MSMRALYTAATGMAAQTLGIDVIANNLANVNTTAFKRQQVNFEDLLYQEIRPAGKTGEGVSVPSGVHIGLGTRIASTTRVFRQGSSIVTERPFDLLIEGAGFFKVTLPDSLGTVGYTRAGAFSRDSEGNLATPGGYMLDPPITIDSDVIEVAIGADGTVMVRKAGETELSTAGQIELVTFANPEGLLSRGENIYLESPASGTEISGSPGENGIGTIKQGTLESSNVEVVRELVSMIEAQRAFEINSQVIQTANENLRVVSNLVRG